MFCRHNPLWHWNPTRVISMLQAGPRHGRWWLPWQPAVVNCSSMIWSRPTPLQSCSLMPAPASVLSSLSASTLDSKCLAMPDISAAVQRCAYTVNRLKTVVGLKSATFQYFSVDNLTQRLIFISASVVELFLLAEISWSENFGRHVGQLHFACSHSTAHSNQSFGGLTAQIGWFGLRATRRSVCIHQMNLVNSHNDYVMMTAP